MKQLTEELAREYARDIVAWAESPHGFYVDTCWVPDGSGGWKVERRRPIVLRDYQKRILRHITTPGPTGRFPFDDVVWAEPKKSGKSTIAALLQEWFAYAVESPGEQYVIANDLEGARTRVYRMLCRSLELKGMGDLVRRYEIQFANGTELRAISTDYRGEAGGNQSLVNVDEPWGILGGESGGGHRLMNEFVSVPTRQVSMRLFTGYGGWSGESLFWETLYGRGLEGDPVPGLEDLPCYRNGRLFMFWSHEPRQPWQEPSYYEAQRRSLRPNAYLRIHEARFVSSESEFVPMEAWEACRGDVQPLTPGDRRAVVLAADASTSRDCTALVGCTYNEDLERVEVVFVRVWEPTRVGSFRLGKATVDLSQTIGAEIERLSAENSVQAVLYDPYQLHSIAGDLARAGTRMVELGQTTRRIETDMALYDAILAGTLAHYGDPTLTEHIKNAITVETARGARLAKEKASRPIDAAVALSMAHYGALEELKRKPDRVLHVQDNFLREGRGPIWSALLTPSPELILDYRIPLGIRAAMQKCSDGRRLPSMEACYARPCRAAVRCRWASEVVWAEHLRDAKHRQVEV